MGRGYCLANAYLASTLSETYRDLLGDAKYVVLELHTREEI